MQMQPLDQNPNFNRLVDAYGDGRIFSPTDIMGILGTKVTRARQFLIDLRIALRDCPEGLQLRSKSGPGGGWYFANL